MTCSEKLYHPTISTWRIVVGLIGVKILYQVNDQRLFENSLIDFVLLLGEVERRRRKALPQSFRCYCCKVKQLASVENLVFCDGDNVNPCLLLLLESR